jgi:cyclophilin family peptidyl-prolyl cis-trans isomerase
MGNMTIQLRDDKPITSSNFKTLVEQGKYDGTIFYRVIEDFMIQGGHTNETFDPIPDEIGTNNSNVKGTIAMANGGPNTASTEFFINVVDNSGTHRYEGFDTSYTVFGNVIEGMDVAETISHVAVDDPSAQSPKPLQDVTLIKAVVLP